MKVGDGGVTVRRIWGEAHDREATIAQERKRAVLTKARAARGAHKRTKQQRQAERDEIAAYLARVPQQQEY